MAIAANSNHAKNENALINDLIPVLQVDLRKVAVGDADEELLGTAVEFADPDLLR